jgi:S1-C subfamily serine protease
MVCLFGLGIGTGYWLLRATAGRPLALPEAQRRAIAALERAPITALAGQNPIVEAVRRIEPAVVNIDTVSRQNNDMGLPWLGEREVRGKGSGVILTADGYIVTNNHVIDEANRIRVTLADGRWFYARKVGSDPQTDLAIVRVEASNLPTAELGDSDKLQVGEWAIAVGNPLGLDSTITVGVISALNRRNLQVGDGKVLDSAIQTDAAINRGNSGGALANIQGQLIGINTAILSAGPSGGSIGLGFSIPAKTVRRVAKEIIETGSARPVVVKRPWLGISFQRVPADVAQSLGLEADRGVQVREVVTGSPASRAGLRPEDVILRIDGKVIGDQRDVIEAIQQRKVGDAVRVHYLRPTDRIERDLTVITEPFPDKYLPRDP